MTTTTRLLPLAALPLALLGCGDSRPASPTPTAPPAPTTTAPPPARFEINTLITVYRSASAFAQWTQGTTNEERLGQILLNVGELSPGTTVLNNEEGRRILQDAIERMVEQFEPEDYVSLFDETQENLRQFFNDADNDGWSVDGRHGVGRDWPHDADGNDPDGWTAQIVVTISSVGE